MQRWSLFHSTLSGCDLWGRGFNCFKPSTLTSLGLKLTKFPVKKCPKLSGKPFGTDWNAEGGCLEDIQETGQKPIWALLGLRYCLHKPWLEYLSIKLMLGFKRHLTFLLQASCFHSRKFYCSEAVCQRRAIACTCKHNQCCWKACGWWVRVPSCGDGCTGYPDEQKARDAYCWIL